MSDFKDLFEETYVGRGKTVPSVASLSRIAAALVSDLNPNIEVFYDAVDLEEIPPPADLNDPYWDSEFYPMASHFSPYGKGGSGKLRSASNVLRKLDKMILNERPDDDFVPLLISLEYARRVEMFREAPPADCITEEQQIRFYKTVINSEWFREFHDRWLGDVPHSITTLWENWISPLVRARATPRITTTTEFTKLGVKAFEPRTFTFLMIPHHRDETREGQSSEKLLISDVIIGISSFKYDEELERYVGWRADTVTINEKFEIRNNSRRGFDESLDFSSDRIIWEFAVYTGERSTLEVDPGPYYFDRPPGIDEFHGVAFMESKSVFLGESYGISGSFHRIASNIKVTEPIQNLHGAISGFLWSDFSNSKLKDHFLLQTDIEHILEKQVPYLAMLFENTDLQSEVKAFFEKLKAHREEKRT